MVKRRSVAQLGSRRARRLSAAATVRRAITRRGWRGAAGRKAHQLAGPDGVVEDTSAAARSLIGNVRTAIAWAAHVLGGAGALAGMRATLNARPIGNPARQAHRDRRPRPSRASRSRGLLGEQVRPSAAQAGSPPSYCDDDHVAPLGWRAAQKAARPPPWRVAAMKRGWPAAPLAALRLEQQVGAAHPVAAARRRLHRRCCSPGTDGAEEQALALSSVSWSARSGARTVREQGVRLHRLSAPIALLGRAQTASSPPSAPRLR